MLGKQKPRKSRRRMQLAIERRKEHRSVESSNLLIAKDIDGFLQSNWMCHAVAHTTALAFLWMREKRTTSECPNT